MLKSVSSIANAIGALNYKGTWNATTNTPALASGSGTKGDYYQVSVAGSTTLDGVSNWGVGDVAAFNGATWQRIEGGADLNGVNLTVTGVATIANENLIIGTAGKGIDFSASSHATGMTSELLNDYEEGTWTPTLITDGTQFTSVTYDTLITNGRYTKIGNTVHIQGSLRTDAVTVGSASGSVCVGGLPHTVIASTSGTQNGISAISIGVAASWAGEEPISAATVANTTRFELYYRSTVDGNTANTAVSDVDTGADKNVVRFSGTYIAA